MFAVVLRAFRRSASALLVALAAAGSSFAQQGPDAPAPVTLTAVEDIKRLCALLHIEPILKRPAYNYDESKGNPFPILPDPLVLKNGEKVTDPKTWWTKRRAEIREDFEREVYGRTPKVTPKVNWEVVSTTRGVNGDIPIVTKQLVGHVDNSSYPPVTVNIRLTLSTPANATGPVPVIMQFGFGPGGRRGPGAPKPAAAPAPGAAAGATMATATPPPGAAPIQGAAPAAAPSGPPWQQQVLAHGWGYAVIEPGSIQADNGAGLTSGIIGLVNKGQPRQLEDWGVLAAWAWGASRALDYLATDPAVDAKRVGLEGHSRWGKATIVTMALDERFAVCFVSSSGEGGTRLHRRDVGQPVDAVTIPEEYHWMAGNFLKYAHRHWDELPVDSHELIALCAPRPVFIGGGGGNGDRGADNKGSFMAAMAASPVYELLGKKGVGATELPAINVALIDGDIGFRLHEGGHTDGPNWPTFLTFASRYFTPPKP